MAADVLPVQQMLLHSWAQAHSNSPRVVLDLYGQDCELGIAPVVHCDLSWHALHQCHASLRHPSGQEAN